jgi:hypothetical protein
LHYSNPKKNIGEKIKNEFAFKKLLKKFGNFCQTLKTTKLRKTEKCGEINFNQPINYNCTTTNNEKNEEKRLGFMSPFAPTE